MPPFLSLGGLFDLFVSPLPDKSGNHIRAGERGQITLGSLIVHDGDSPLKSLPILLWHIDARPEEILLPEPSRLLSGGHVKVI